MQRYRSTDNVRGVRGTARAVPGSKLTQPTEAYSCPRSHASHYPSVGHRTTAKPPYLPILFNLPPIE